MLGIKVRVLTSGLWSINPPNPGETRITEGETRSNIPQQLVDRMLKSKAVKVLKTGTEEGERDHVMKDVSDIRATLIEIADKSDNKNDAKKALKSWTKENLGFDLDVRRNVDNCIADIIAAYEGQNG